MEFLFTVKKIILSILLPLQAPTPQNCQTHSNNSSATADEFFQCFLTVLCG